MDTARLKGPFEPRKAAIRLKDLLVESLVSEPPAVGTPFFSDSELMEATGLSRKTVRKALDQLHREGWIERVAGRGSFVGPRVTVPMASRLAKIQGGRRTVRLAVLAYGFSGSAPDWYSQGVLDGIDQVAIEQGVSIELIGSHTTDPRSVGQRLAQSRPDVLIAMPPSTRMALLIGEAQRLGIPSIIVDTRFMDLGCVTVCEDGVQGAACAVEYLVSKGHRRIGLIQRPDTAPWVFARREGYVRGMIQSGIGHDERMVLWLTNDKEKLEQDAATLAAFIERQRPTAILIASAFHARTVGHLVRKTGLRIPEDISLISFDQYNPGYREELGFVPTTIDLPLREMGRKAAELARRMVEQQPIETVTYLPCELQERASVATLPNSN